MSNSRERSRDVVRPLIYRRDETYNFFKRDTAIRLKRTFEYLAAYTAFVWLLILRLLVPGGDAVWQLIKPHWIWIAVFMPLFVLDARNVRFARYLWKYQDRWPKNEAKRYTVLVCTEFLYKAVLVLYLWHGWAKTGSLILVAMFSFGGYLIQFILGNCLAEDEGQRAESWGAVQAMMSGLFRFLLSAQVASVCLKLAPTKLMDDWRSVFWPCWGLEGIIALLIPACVTYGALHVRGRKRIRLFLPLYSWLVLGGLLTAVAVFFTAVSLLQVFNNQFCPPDPAMASLHMANSTASASDRKCFYLMEWALLPWATALPLFTVLTWLLQKRLAKALHKAWYQRGDSDPPPPLVMFKVTATYYAREPCMDATIPEASPSLPSLGRLSRGSSWHSGRAEASGFQGLASPTHQWNSSLVVLSEEQTLAVPGSEAASFVSGSGAALSSPPSYGRGNRVLTPRVLSGDDESYISADDRVTPGTNSLVSRVQAEPPFGRTVSVASHYSHYSHFSQRSYGSAVDVSASILSARGSHYNEIVHEEQLCFVCFDAHPNAILLECGHGGMCLDCAVRLLDTTEGDPSSVCPICRSTITRVLKIRRDKALPAVLFKDRAPGEGLPSRSASVVLSRTSSAHRASSYRDLESGTAGGDVSQEQFGLGSMAAGPPWPYSTRSKAVYVEVYKSRARRSLPESSPWRRADSAGAISVTE